MGGGGGSPPAPKTFTPPPLQQGPVSAPIPNFFAGRQAGPSPYSQMANFVPQATQGPFGNAVDPMRFAAPQMQVAQPTPQEQAVAQIVEAIAAQPRPTEMTKEEYLKAGGRLGKGQR